MTNLNGHSNGTQAHVHGATIVTVFPVDAADAADWTEQEAQRRLAALKRRIERARRRANVIAYAATAALVLAAGYGLVTILGSFPRARWPWATLAVLVFGLALWRVHRRLRMPESIEP